MPAEYVAMRESLRKRCEEGKAKGKKEDETCLEYAKRVASMTYYKKHGKTPQQAESGKSVNPHGV